MDETTSPKLADDLDGFVRVPGMFRRSEIQQVLRPGCDFHIQPERLPSGTHLFAVYQQEANDVASWPVCGPPLANHERPARTPSRARPEPRPSPIENESRAPVNEPSLGELKARRREEHLCFACTHHLVCKMASALDETLLVTISRCLGFEPAELGDGATCELIPIEPSAAP
jgi:hypothetical protein